MSGKDSRFWANPRFPIFIAALVVIIGIPIGVSLKKLPSRETAQSFQNDAEPSYEITPEDTRPLRQISDAVRRAVSKVSPAVVSLNVKVKSQPERRQLFGFPFGDPDDSGQNPFEDFFAPFQAPPSEEEEKSEAAIGSGIVIDASGIIVTNHHVVERSTEILVNFSRPGFKLKGTVIGSDPGTDLAIVRVQPENPLPVAEWAETGSTEVGDWALAIGSPFALGDSVTLGIVSAVGRPALSITGAGFGETLIQTDAAINPGNSGGALCDLEGRVIGVNTAIYSRNGGYMGIGFAIPADTARKVAAQLLASGKVTRGWLGIHLQPLPDALAKNMKIPGGISIQQVMEGSPAAKAKLRAGDIIVSLDGKPVEEVSDLQRIVSSKKPGATIRLTVVSYQTNKRRSVRLAVGEMPNFDKDARPVAQSDDPDKLGISVKLDPETKHLVIDEIAEDSPAALARLQTGDVILRINRQEMTSREKYLDTIQQTNVFYIEIERKGVNLFVQVETP